MVNCNVSIQYFDFDQSDKDEPWTADDIRKNAPNWSLHCDGKLLEYMKKLSMVNYQLI